MEHSRTNANLKSGISIDDVFKIRVLDSDTATTTDLLKNVCYDFVESTENFQNITEGFLTMLTLLSNSVENEKMKAIGASNVLNSMSRKRESTQTQLKLLLLEKTAELERLRTYHQSLLKTKEEQQEHIDLIIMNN